MRTLLIIFLFFAVSVTVFGQTSKELFEDNSYDYYWYGIDYSNVKLIGNFSTSTLSDEEDHHLIYKRYFKAWNALIKNERNKFSVEKMLRKDVVIYDTQMISEVNKGAQVDELVAERSCHLEQTIIDSAINNYQLEQKEGVGVVFLAEYLDKTNTEASYVMIVFNIANRKKLIEKRFITKPVGFGMRNYWAGSFYTIFRSVKEFEFELWRNEFQTQLNGVES